MDFYGLKSEFVIVKYFNSWARVAPEFGSGCIIYLISNPYTFYGKIIGILILEGFRSFLKVARTLLSDLRCFGVILRFRMNAIFKHKISIINLHATLF